MKRRDKGLTLAELLFAFAILAFVAIGCLSLFASGKLLNASNGDLGLAASHAEYVLENIRNTSFNNISSDINNGAWNLDANAISAADMVALSGETITTTVSGTNELDVLVKVSWQRSEDSRIEYFSTIISNI